MKGELECELGLFNMVSFHYLAPENLTTKMGQVSDS